MPTKIILDAALLLECEMMGSNSSGMLRLAEEISSNLLKKEDLDISFANTVYTQQHHQHLKKLVLNKYPSHAGKILSKKPFFVSDKPLLKNWTKRFSDRFSPKVKISQLESNDVFHSFYYPFPTNIEKSKIKKSITYLDIIPLRISGYQPQLIDRTRKIVESIVPNFAISISEFSKQDLLDYDKRIDPDRVFVAPLAASKELFFQNRNVDEWKAVKKKYKLPENYFLSLSASDKRRNIPHLIKSFSKFILQQKPKDLFLVLTGNSTHSHTLLDELELEKCVRDRIFLTERHIENKDLSAIYSNALCFFFMSLYEGFGLPVLEAMQCGAPVVCANATSLPEIVGDAGVLLPTEDEDALCEVMNQMYSSMELRNKYSHLGLERSKQFSWQRCAEEYTAIFKKITNNN